MSLLAVDIGNSSIAAGLFADDWRRPARHWRWPDVARIAWDRLPSEPVDWWVASVRRPWTRALREELARRRPEDRWRTVQGADFPISAAVEDMAAVGADRLAAAVAVNQLRHPSRPAIVVDAGSAITVDVVDQQGVFRGGAILPGMAMAAQALALDADLLPRIQPAQQPPPAVGDSTAAAIRSGLYWGALGAIRELIRQMSAHSPAPEVFVTGGGVLWPQLTPQARYEDHLVLAGVAFIAQACQAPS
jgi:type III pantothenate kinase